MGSIFLYLIILFAVVFVVTTIMIYSYLKTNGENVSFLWLRLKMISYANKYRDITRKKTGKTGPLFYLWIISINLALICSILFFVLNN